MQEPFFSRSQVLKHCPGALILISHDIAFLKAVNVVDWYQVEDGFYDFFHKRMTLIYIMRIIYKDILN